MVSLAKQHKRVDQTISIEPESTTQVGTREPGEELAVQWRLLLGESLGLSRYADTYLNSVISNHKCK